MTRSAVVTGVAGLAMAAGFGAGEVRAQPAGVATGPSWQVDGLAGWSAPSGLDGGGKVSVGRAFFGVGVSVPVGAGTAIGLSAGGGATDYTFSDGAQPLWSDIRDARVSLPIRFGLGETTRAIIIPSLRWSAETDADLEDGQTEGVIAAVYWKLSDSLTIGPGLGVFSELTDDTDWFPFLAIDWAITDRWSLSTGQGVGATQGPGLALSYQTTDALSLGVAARYESTQFRLDDGGIAPGGIGESRSVPVVLTLDWRPNPGIGVSAFAGVETGAELTLRDSDGSTVSQSDVDPAAILGAQVIVRF